MRDTWSAHEIWLYQCLCCHSSWQREYDARHMDDGHGGEAVTYEHGGHRCTSPWCDHMCPNCQSQNVKASEVAWTKPSKVPAPRSSEDLAMLFRLRRMNAY